MLNTQNLRAIILNLHLQLFYREDLIDVIMHMTVARKCSLHIISHKLIQGL